MERMYIITGAFGHLGYTIMKMLVEDGKNVRGLVLPSDNLEGREKLQADIVRGNVCDINSLIPLFTFEEKYEVIVIHTAGIVSIASKFNQLVYDVNVNGTKNIIEMCKKYNVQRFIHVSSVHAIPEKPNNECITEVDKFNPDDVVGLYAKTKAEATQLVLDSKKDGLDVVVVHPAGIIGPNDYGKGHLTQLVIDYCKGTLTASIKGGYNFVDVRDVAQGIISAIDNGKSGECYILSNKFYSLNEFFDMLYAICNRPRIKTILPIWFAKLTAPLAELYYKILKQPPLYTKYSIYTINTNSNFSYEKAKRDLGYITREMKDTLRDTVLFLVNTGRINKNRIR